MSTLYIPFQNTANYVFERCREQRSTYTHKEFQFHSIA